MLETISNKILEKVLGEIPDLPFYSPEEYSKSPEKTFEIKIAPPRENNVPRPMPRPPRGDWNAIYNANIGVAQNSNASYVINTSNSSNNYIVSS